MKRKPTSMRDFLITVMGVQHPKLRPEHRHFLSALAPYADYATGRSAYPGMANLTRAMGKSEDSIQRYAKECEKFGLIERRNGKAHKGMAAEWRFCLENPAVPRQNLERVLNEQHADGLVTLLQDEIYGLAEFRQITARWTDKVRGQRLPSGLHSH